MNDAAINLLGGCAPPRVRPAATALTGVDPCTWTHVVVRRELRQRRIHGDHRMAGFSGEFRRPLLKGVARIDMRNSDDPGWRNRQFKYVRTALLRETEHPPGPGRPRLIHASNVVGYHRCWIIQAPGGQISIEPHRVIEPERPGYGRREVPETNCSQPDHRSVFAPISCLCPRRLNAPPNVFSGLEVPIDSSV